MLRKMIPIDIFTDDLMSAVIRFGLYIGAVFQLICLFASVTVSEEITDPYHNELDLTDSDDYSSEQSTPSHRAFMPRLRRHDKKKRR